MARRAFLAGVLGVVLVLCSLPRATSVRAETSGDLDALRQRALAAVNQSRSDNGLPPLTLGENLNEAAQAHAEDMFRRRYYSHTSPDGGTVQDRYVAAGGSKWELIAENIARCENCPPPPTEANVERLERGWMNSPEHRENILRHGLARFGYGIVVDATQGLYAVQTFAGPGTPRGASAGEAAAEIPPDRQVAVALDRINAARREAKVAPLAASDALDTAARALVPDPQADELSIGGGGSLRDALPAGARRDWRTLSTLAAACGGCGTAPTAADLRFFVGQWLDGGNSRRTLLDERFGALGLALVTDGKGKKVALVVLGASR